MKRLSLVQVVAFAAIAVAALNPLLKADEYDRKTVISISQPLEVPGVVLPPGTYVMKLLNSSSNRHIVQFMNERQNQQLALTFAVSAERVRPAEKTLLTMYEGSRGSPSAIRTWFYPGDTVGQEFLYPHGQAVRISERTNAVVPETETKPASVAAADAAQGNESAEPVLVARAAPAPEPTPEPVPAPVATATPEPAPEPIPEAVAAPEPQQPADEPQSPPVAAPESLPQTAGIGPLAGLIGVLSLALALFITNLKRRAF